MRKYFAYCEIKEPSGNHLVKIDKFSGNVDDLVSFLVDKYGAKIPSRLKRVFEAAGEATNHAKQK